MIENISKKQEKVQEKIQKQQELNDKDCRELTDEELDQIVGGAGPAQAVAQFVATTQGVQGAVVTLLDAQADGFVKKKGANGQPYVELTPGHF